VLFLDQAIGNHFRFNFYRFPALSYYHKQTGTSLWRCSQSLTGLFNSRSEFDEKMMREIGALIPEDNNDEEEIQVITKNVVILDARLKMSAQFNRFKGGGHEHEQYYDNCIIEFCNIDNVHAVRDAYKKCFPSWEGKICYFYLYRSVVMKNKRRVLR